MQARAHGALAFAFAFSLVLTAGMAVAQTITVDTLDDEADPPFNQAAPDPLQLYCGAAAGRIVDLPGSDGRVSLREAVIAANNTPGPQTITFAPALRNATIRLTFDTPDEDPDPDPFPFLCNNGTTVDGDLDGDDLPDITLDGSAVPPDDASIDDGFVIVASDCAVNGMRLSGFSSGAIGVLHLFGAPPVARNRISNNEIRDTQSPIFINAGTPSALGPLVGSVSDTTISDNTIADAESCGICILTGDAEGSSIDRTAITDNRVSGAQNGILIQANFPNGGADTAIRDTMISGNDLANSRGTGIVVFSYAGQRNVISGLTIAENAIRDNGFIGISLVSGACGASFGSLQVEIRSNDLEHNGPPDLTSGIFAAAGGNYNCPFDAPPATNNTLDLTIASNTLREDLGTPITILGGGDDANGNTTTTRLEDNIIRDGSGFGISIVGGSAATAIGANDNVVDAQLMRNVVNEVAAGGLSILGAFGNADDNSVTITVDDNTFSQNSTGIGITGAFTNDEEVPTGNSVSATITGNRTCLNRDVDLYCDQGVQPPPPPGEGGSGIAPNEVTATFTDNTAAIVSTSGCGEPMNTLACACPGDCNGDRETHIDELIASVDDALRGTEPQCTAADSDSDGVVTVEDLVRAITAVLRSCEG